MKRLLLLFILSIFMLSAYAQKPVSIKIKDPVICYATTTNTPLHIPPPEEYLAFKKAKNGGREQNSATIEVTYIGFPEDVNGIGPHASFQAAVDIWEGLITSSMPIRIEARWTPLSAGVLGSANYTSAYANFEGAQKLNVFYPVAIAEKITGREMNGGEPDLFANFSSSIDWHLDPNTEPFGKYDLKTVVMHEIGHGLGFSGTFTVSGTQGRFGLSTTTIPIAYDVPIRNGANANLIETYTSPSADLRTQLTGQSLFFTSSTVQSAKLYAPLTFDGGSSISHVDESTYNGSVNALMTPQIGMSERIGNPGISLGMLKDLGWSHTKIIHTPVAAVEAITEPYTIKAIIQADAIGYMNNSVKLNYTLNGTSFISLDMTATGTTNEFSADIPSAGIARSYGYYISVRDNDNREFVNPGKRVTALQTQQQNIFVFTTGPDTQAPKITHTPKEFILDSEAELTVDAKVTDNLGLKSIELEYFKNSSSIGTLPMTLTSPGQDSIYTTTINLAALGLTLNDQINYRIIATDASVIGNPNGNTAYSPSATELHTVNVVGLEPTQDSYGNNFNANSTDFFGNGFTIATPSGFQDGAIHSAHPYQAGEGQPNNAINLVYQLKVPIRVKASEAIIKFDEIVLIEPGDLGSVFGDDNFYDYVVVEGSKDGGANWTPLADGYDSRVNTVWLTRYNSSSSGNNSTAIGDPTLFRSRSIDMQQKFDTDDEVVIRFRLYSDQLAVGWGWAIDNLKIQIDDTPPGIQHRHIDYITEEQNFPSLTVSVTESSEIGDVVLNFRVNTTEFTGTVTASNVVSGQVFTFELPSEVVESLEYGDLVEYSITTSDASGNIGSFPSAGFINVPIISFGEPVNQYSNTFNVASNDFIGNFFSITTPSGFESGAIHSLHFYPVGQGLDLTSDFSYVLKKPIRITSANPYIRFDEITLIEGHNSGVVFGSPAFKDYVIVEGSKDGGETWNRFLDGYDIIGNPAWVSAFNSQLNGTPALYKTRSINMLGTSSFNDGDEVLIRFRLFSNENINGWGWAIDNLYIQDVITGIENQLETSISVYPNPSAGNITVSAEGQGSSEFSIQLVTMQGQKMYEASERAIDGKMTHTIPAQQIPAGMYLVKISKGGTSAIRKVIKTN